MPHGGRVVWPSGKKDVDWSRCMRCFKWVGWQHLPENLPADSKKWSQRRRGQWLNVIQSNCFGQSSKDNLLEYQYLIDLSLLRFVSSIGLFLADSLLLASQGCGQEQGHRVPWKKLPLVEWKNNQFNLHIFALWHIGYSLPPYCVLIHHILSRFDGRTWYRSWCSGCTSQASIFRVLLLSGTWEIWYHTWQRWTRVAPTLVFSPRFFIFF